jgi:hypothetical protein
LVMLFLPFFVGKWIIIRSIFFKPFLKSLVLVYIVNSLILGWVGGQPVVAPYYTIGQVVTFVYFFLIFIIILISILENIVLKYYLFNLKNFDMKW